MSTAAGIDWGIRGGGAGHIRPKRQESQAGGTEPRKPLGRPRKYPKGQEPYSKEGRQAAKLLREEKKEQRQKQREEAASAAGATKGRKQSKKPKRTADEAGLDQGIQELQAGNDAVLEPPVLRPRKQRKTAAAPEPDAAVTVTSAAEPPKQSRKSKRTANAAGLDQGVEQSQAGEQVVVEIPAPRPQKQQKTATPKPARTSRATSAAGMSTRSTRSKRTSDDAGIGEVAQQSQAGKDVAVEVPVLRTRKQRKTTASGPDTASQQQEQEAEAVPAATTTETPRRSTRSKRTADDASLDEVQKPQAGVDAVAGRAPPRSPKQRKTTTPGSDTASPQQEQEAEAAPAATTTETPKRSTKSKRTTDDASLDTVPKPQAGVDAAVGRAPLRSRKQRKTAASEPDGASQEPEQTEEVLRAARTAENPKHAKSPNHTAHDAGSEQLQESAAGNDAAAEPLVLETRELPTTTASEPDGSSQSRDETTTTSVAPEPQKPEKPTRNRKYKKLDKGSVDFKRRRIVTDLMEKSGGVFPGDRDLWYPFSIIWMKMNPNVGIPDLRTVQRMQKALIDAGQIKSFIFAYTNRRGQPCEKRILALPHVQPDSPAVKELEAKLKELGREHYVPPNTGITEEERKHFAKISNARTGPLPKETVIEEVTARVELLERPQIPGAEVGVDARVSEAERIKRAKQRLEKAAQREVDRKGRLERKAQRLATKATRELLSLSRTEQRNAAKEIRTIAGLGGRGAGIGPPRVAQLHGRPFTGVASLTDQRTAAGQLEEIAGETGLAETAIPGLAPQPPTATSLASLFYKLNRTGLYDSVQIFHPTNGTFGTTFPPSKTRKKSARKTPAARASRPKNTRSKGKVPQSLGEIVSQSRRRKVNHDVSADPALNRFEDQVDKVRRWEKRYAQSLEKEGESWAFINHTTTGEFIEAPHGPVDETGNAPPAERPLQFSHSKLGGWAQRAKTAEAAAEAAAENGSGAQNIPRSRKRVRFTEQPDGAPAAKRQRKQTGTATARVKAAAARKKFKTRYTIAQPRDEELEGYVQVANAAASAAGLDGLTAPGRFHYYLGRIL